MSTADSGVDLPEDEEPAPAADGISQVRGKPGPGPGPELSHWLPT